ncbi:hypothetical protein [Spirosoma endbachense]|uniref:Uncharacterized protein n=1 Tax=Spirosoma endbachense TaxID=2666025 RepID=A0A6P1VW09_9BACT|nr:hypothetical protein [Spirosoma endbachense]QHV97293.1 hypothetical protein GJR95_20790 [Spirosoma endbachense]
MITQEQYRTIVDFREAEQTRYDRQVYLEGVKAIELALRHILFKEVVYREDFFQLEETLPGTTASCAKALGYSEIEFSQQLAQGMVLDARLKKGLEAMLAVLV